MLKSITLVALAVVAITFDGLAQHWQEVASTQRIAGERLIAPATYRSVSTSPDALWDILRNAPHIENTTAKNSAVILELPAPDGTMHSFSISEFPVMAPELQERFPTIRSYAGQGITDPSATLRFSMSPTGLRAMVISNGSTWYIDPMTNATTEVYQSYTKTAFYATTTKVFEELPPITSDMDIDLEDYKPENRTELQNS